MEPIAGAAPLLTRESNGIFDVLVDDEVVFSKHSEGRFPNDGEIAALISN